MILSFSYQRSLMLSVQDDLVVGTGTGLTSFTGFAANVVVTRASAASALLPTSMPLTVTVLATAALLCMSLLGLY